VTDSTHSKSADRRAAPMPPWLSGALRLLGLPFPHRVEIARLVYPALVALALLLLAFAAGAAFSQTPSADPGPGTPIEQSGVPPAVKQAQRFLAHRRLAPSRFRGDVQGARSSTAKPAPQTAATGIWKATGPAAVISLSYGLVTGRVSSLALDPSGPTGNRLYLGTSGGGVWLSQNAGASNTASVAFLPLTDNLTAFTGAQDASISIGALTVQPGGTGVVLAGTGDPNDALDSYYGDGILRSADGGQTWTLIQKSADRIEGQAGQNFFFTGEGFAGFAWSTINPQLVVAAVSQAFEGTLVNAVSPGHSYEGLYYSLDSGVTWHLATITDGTGIDVQGPTDQFTLPDGNAATAVVWNPARALFMAAVRYHGYYGSPDGITWTRMSAQPGTGLTTQSCPTNPLTQGSPYCPIFRGALAVNPVTGDTFAWSVDLNNQDQGVWQDECAIKGGSCTNPSVTFAHRLDTSPFEMSSAPGPATIENGDYNLALAAVPQAQDTMLLAGDNDLWSCSLAAGCAWRNTTNTNTCKSAQVGEYQHALAWNAANPLEVFVGNDSGVWRSTDAIGETGPVCASTDASHFQNLNGGLGSLADVEGVAQDATTPYTAIVGLGPNGIAGVKSGAPVSHWPQVLNGDGGPVAIDPDDPSQWFANNQAGVSIYLCSQGGPCTPSAFGTSPVVNNADVDGDGLTMTAPASFMVDRLDSTQLLVATCRVWRGPSDGSPWSTANAISPILDGNVSNVACSGDASIRSMDAIAIAGNNETIYVGMYGSADGGTILPGHVLSATLNQFSVNAPLWQDLTFNPVGQSGQGLNPNGLDISSIFIDPHDPSGNTVYVTVEGFYSATESVALLYGSTDGGAHWADLTSNLIPAPANSVLVDPQDANTVYLATDAGVFSTRRIGTCSIPQSDCWTVFGAGLPLAPVVGLAATSLTAPAHVLIAATFGRGLWQTPLWTEGISLTTAILSPASLVFPKQVSGSSSDARTLTLKNTGTLPLTPGSITVSGDFGETGACAGASLAIDASCGIQVIFTPTQTGVRAGVLTIEANVAGGQLTVPLTGTGIPAGAVSLLPSTVDFGPAETGTRSAPFQVEAANAGETAVSITGFSVSGPFEIASNTCGSQLASGSQCQLTLQFSPTQAGAATGKLTMTEGAKVLTVQLTGLGVAPPGDTLSASELTFPATVEGQLSSPLVVALTNNGGLPLTSIGTSVRGPFQAAGNCGTLLPAHSSCAISVVFAPPRLGVQTGTLIVSDLQRQQTIALSGTGVQPGAFTVSPSSLVFAAEKVGVSTPALTLKVSNTGQAPIANVGFQILPGPFTGSFAIGATTCGANLQNGSSCVVNVTFTPASTGGSAATLIISSSSVGVAQISVPLIGTGVSSTGLNVSPTQLAFAAVLPGQTSPAQTVTISDTGKLTMTSLALEVSSQFSIVQNTCPASLAPQKQCTAGITFSPAASGPVSGAFSVTSSAVATSATVALSGSGAVAPGIQVRPGLVTFPTTGVGLKSDPITVTVTNTGTLTTLTGLEFKIAGQFFLVGNTCAAALAPAASCTTGVGFAPGSAGPETGSLTVSSEGVAGGAVALSGTGFDFTVKASGATSQTVANGQTATFSLIVTPLNGASGMFTMACGPIPANAQCVFNPTSLTVSAGSTGFMTVGVATGQTQSSSLSSLRLRMFPLACGLVLLPLAWKRRPKALLLGALLAILTAGVSSCLSASGGQGGNQPGGPGATPAGTYSIPVIVTSDGVQHGVTVVLTVD
jgi:hypothetical protein